MNINLPNQPPFPDRRMAISLTDEEIEVIAEKAANKAVAKMTAMVYQEVGRGVINKLLWVVGITAVGLYVFLQQKGVIK